MDLPCPLEATSEFRYYSAVRCFGRSMAHPPRRGHYPPRPSWWHQVRQNSMVGVRRTEHFNVPVVPPWKTTLRDPAPVTSTLLLPLILSWVRQVRALNGQNYMVGDRQTEHVGVFAAPPWMTALHDSAPVLSTLLPPLILSWARQARVLIRQNYTVGGQQTKHFDVSAAPPWTTALLDPAPAL